MLPFLPRKSSQIEEALQSGDYEVVEISPRIAALSLEPPQLPRVPRAATFARKAEVRSVAPPVTKVGSRPRPWPRPVPARRVVLDRSSRSESSIAAAVISTGDAEVVTDSDRLADRPRLSLGAGLGASALLALGILVGVVLTVVGRGEADPLYERATEWADPSASFANGSALAPASAVLPPAYPLPPPVTAAVQLPLPLPVLIGRPGREGAAPFKVDALPRAATHVLVTKKNPPPHPPSASTLTTPPKPVVAKADTDEIDAAKQANSRAKQENAVTLGGSD